MLVDWHELADEKGQVNTGLLLDPDVTGDVRVVCGACGRFLLSRPRRPDEAPAVLARIGLRLPVTPTTKP
jgi:hypothetical protein